MAKGRKRPTETKGKKITLKMAKNAMQLTMDGKRRLNLSNMGIATFPKCILKLCDVDELDLSRNLLRKIPDSISRFVNLRWLDLHSNQLEQLPETIGRLQNLCSLNLSNNHLTTSSLPREVGLLAKLQSLNLGLNRLESLPSSLAALKDLQDLGLFNNQLTRVPDWLRKLPKLQKLNTNGNPLPSERPEMLEPIKRVESLYLVKESCLCRACIQHYREKKERLDHHVSAAEQKKTRTRFTGLIAPNSVAQENQALWR
ncbi:leucine-rich repeat-containing protein 18 [Denticeps clupeoides]|nr:leucine-rich repeat-containing protein 18 [Denticeps clupeoides]XP_028825854.1 leucine-rich repeat-containing protein 18 [Denticeps clupeoides]